MIEKKKMMERRVEGCKRNIGKRREKKSMSKEFKMEKR